MRKDFQNSTISFFSSPKKAYQHERFIAGIPPYTRGIYASMYFKNPLEIITKINPSFKVIDTEETGDLEVLITNTIKKAKEYVEKELEQGEDIDTILSNLIVELPNLEMFDAIVFAKSIRTIWSKIATTFHLNNKESTALKMVFRMTENDISQAMTAVFCGVQYLCLPKNNAFSEEEWEYLINEELQLTNVIDPWGGNSYIEKVINTVVKETL